MKTMEIKLDVSNFVVLFALEKNKNTKKKEKKKDNVFVKKTTTTTMCSL